MADIDILTAQPTPGAVFKGYSADIEKGPEPRKEGQQVPDVIARVTCESIDADNEIVLASGCVLDRYNKARRIMLCHAYGRPGEYYPLPVGEAMWTRQEGTAILQGIRFARSSAMGREVLGLFQEGMLNTFSIGFQALEASPPTKDELKAHPAWAGVKLIHRKWRLLEVSVVPIPSNPDAIVLYQSKGHRMPPRVWFPSFHTRGDNVTLELKVIRHVDGHYDLMTHDGSRLLGRHASKEDAEAQERAIEAAKHAGKEIDDHVAVNKAMGGGCGTIKSIHAKGRIHDGESEVDASEETPAIEVEMHGPTHQPTGGTKMFHHKHLEKIEGENVDYDRELEKSAKDDGGEENVRGAEEQARYEEMKADLIQRHKGILHSEHAGHLYTHPDHMKAHYVRHEDDDDLEKGYHTPEQIKAMLGGSKHCKGVAVEYEHPDEDKGFERIQPPVEVDLKTGMAEGSGTSGGYTVGEHEERFDPDHDGDDDSTAAGDTDHDYVPAPGQFVKWDAHHGMHAGAGRVKSIHRKGRVPDVMNEAEASEEHPHARIKVYKVKPDSPHTYHETEHHVAVHVKHLKAMDMVAGFGEKGAELEHVVSDEQGTMFKFLSDPAATKAVVPFKPGPVVDGPFEEPAVVARLRKWASKDGSGSKESMDWGKYEQAFAYCDPERKEDFGSYKYVHHDVRGGKLVVVKRGVTSRIGDIDGARGGVTIPESDRAGVKAHLEKHRREFEKDGKGDSKPEPKSTEPPTPAVLPKFRTREQVLASLEREARERIQPLTEEQLKVEAIKTILGSVS